MLNLSEDLEAFVCKLPECALNTNRAMFNEGWSECVKRAWVSFMLSTCLHIMLQYAMLPASAVPKRRRYNARVSVLTSLTKHTASRLKFHH